jgi:triacylglycerol lipase
MRLDTTWGALLKPGHAKRYFDAEPLPVFQAAPKGFRRENAWWLAELSRLIYRRSPGETGQPPEGPPRCRLLEQAGLAERRFFDAGSVQAAIITGDARFTEPFGILVFRGTIGQAASWILNLDALPVPWPHGGWVHRGFKRQFDRIWPSIDAELARIRLPFHYTGHSLGAALAVMAAAHRRPHAVYSFGSPRIGSPGFVRSLQRLAIYRISNHSDIVTAMPLGYHHAGIPQQPCRPATAGRLKRPAWYRRFTHTPQFLAQHAPVNYTNRVAPVPPR